MLDAEGASLRRIAAATGVSTATVRVALGRVSPRRAYCAEQDPAEQDAAGETADDPVEDPDLGPAEIDTGVRGAVPTPAGQGRTPGTPQPRRPARGQQGSGRTGAYVLKSSHHRTVAPLPDPLAPHVPRQRRFASCGSRTLDH